MEQRNSTPAWSTYNSAEEPTAQQAYTDTKACSRAAPTAVALTDEEAGRLLVFQLHAGQRGAVEEVPGRRQHLGRRQELGAVQRVRYVVAGKQARRRHRRQRVVRGEGKLVAAALKRPGYTWD